MKEKLRTTDLWQASFLLAKGAELTSLEKDPEKTYRVAFVLTGENLKEQAQGFNNNEGVPVLTFKQVLLDLKHKLYRKNQNIEIDMREKKDGLQRTGTTS